jgi:DNA-binding response OmpR family regulator
MKKILIIEDEPDVRDNIAELLQLNNYSTKTLVDGRNIIAEVRDFKPDLIICDVIMTPPNGYGILALLRQNEDTDSIPFLFLTADATIRFVSGLDVEYLLKPFASGILLKKIAAVLSS